MNPTARKYIDLFRAVKVASAATVDAQGRPQSRIINVMLALDEGMVIVTSRGKPFWKQLTESGLVALSAMCPECQSLKFTGSVRRMEDSRAWVDEVFLHNPGMNEVYPGQSRYALDAFLIYEGGGEWFDLLHHPICLWRHGDGTGRIFHSGNLHRLRRMCFGLPAAVHYARHTLSDRPDALPAVRAVHRALPG